VGGFFSTAGVGCAPAASDRGIRQQIGVRARQAQALLDFVVDAGEEQQGDAVDRFQAAQREISNGLANILNTNINPEGWFSFVSAPEFDLANEMETRQIRLVPNQDILTAVVERPVRSVNAEDGEPIFDVLLKILFDALGIYGPAQDIIGFLKNNERVKGMFVVFASSIKGALKDRRFAEVATNCRRFIELIVSHETLADLEAKLGKDIVARLLNGIAARFVPFLGWSLFVASLLVSIYYNREKLAKATF
jgi:hypothetical protein